MEAAIQSLSETLTGFLGVDATGAIDGDDGDEPALVTRLNEVAGAGHGHRQPVSALMPAGACAAVAVRADRRLLTGNGGAHHRDPRGAWRQWLNAGGS